MLNEETMASPSHCVGSHRSRIQGRKMNNEPKNLLDYICTVSFSQMKEIVFYASFRFQVSDIVHSLSYLPSTLLEKLDKSRRVN
jgi:hypothetical protein